MKKLFIIILSVILPLSMYASSKDEIKSMNFEEVLLLEGIEPLFDNYEENERQIPVYLFMGQGEIKSVSFLNFINSIYKDYGYKFRLIVYEVGSNPANSKLMDNVIDKVNSNSVSVPLIIIGNDYFETYNDDMNSSIINSIDNAYESESSTDKIHEVMDEYYRDNNLIGFIILFLILIFIIAMVYASLSGRKSKND